MKRNFNMIWLAILVCLAMSSLVFANDTVVEIGSVTDLQALATAINEGTADDISWKLTANIDLSNENSWAGIGASDHPFTGTFDGGNKTVTLPNGATAGLFNYVTGGTIQDVNVAGDVITTADVFGAVVSYMNGGTVASCTSSTEIEGTTVGGIVGQSDGSTTIEQCSNTGDVTGTTVGGILGESQDGSAGLYMKECSNRGTITGTQYTGGIVGFVRSSKTEILYCYRLGSIVGSTSRTGGIVGEVDINGNETALIKACYSAGTRATTNTTDVGCIVGETDSKRTTIENCYQSVTDGNGNFMIRIAGDEDTITTCYADGIPSHTVNLTIGTVLAGWSEDVWTFTYGMLPRLTYADSENDVIANAATAYVTDNEIEVSAIDGGVWTFGNGGDAIKNGEEYTATGTELTLVFTYEGYTKTIKLDVTSGTTYTFDFMGDEDNRTTPVITITETETVGKYTYTVTANGSAVATTDYKVGYALGTADEETTPANSGAATTGGMPTYPGTYFFYVYVDDSVDYNSTSAWVKFTILDTLVYTVEDEQTTEYTGAAQGITWEITSSNYTGTPTVTYTLNSVTVDEPTEAGTYAYVLTFPTDDVYAEVEIEGSFTITEWDVVDLVVTAETGDGEPAEVTGNLVANQAYRLPIVENEDGKTYTWKLVSVGGETVDEQGNYASDMEFFAPTTGKYIFEAVEVVEEEVGDRG